jgi:hypothetical protein
MAESFDGASQKSSPEIDPLTAADDRHLRVSAPPSKIDHPPSMPLTEGLQCDQENGDKKLL